MTPEPLITIDDVVASGLCVTGTRTWFKRHRLDLRSFLRHGIDAETLLATGDAMAKHVVDHVRHRSQVMQRQG